jgi:drug/metabolite transporter (DMT)-like permease
VSATAIVLITISVFAHAGWNLFSKRQPSAAFFLVASSTSALTLTPLLWYNRTLLAWTPPAVWALVAVTGLFQAIYYSGVAGAYRHGDMSLAYPMLRSLPVLLVTAISFALGRGDQITPLGLAGIITVAAGCLMLPLKSFREIHLRDYLALCCLLALVAAVGTTGYTLIDDEALRQLRTGLSWMDKSHVTLFYIAMQTLSTSAWVAIFVLLQPSEHQRLQAIWREGRWRAAVSGLVITGAYGLVLASMAYVSNVSYVAAFRQMSIPLGALLGIFLLKEPRYPPKLIGVGVVSAGLALVALF